MSNFSIISLSDLDLVTGGDGQDTGIFGAGAGPNRENIEGSAGVQTPVGVKVDGSGKYQTSASDQQACIQSAIKAGADPLAAIKACR